MAEPIEDNPPPGEGPSSGGIRPIRDVLPSIDRLSSGSTQLQSDRPPQDSGCSLCGGAGFLRQDVPLEHPEFGKIVPCQCRLKITRTKRLQQLRQVSDMDSLAHYTFDRFKPEGVGIPSDQSRSLMTVYQAAVAFAADPKGWLVILGGYGCGKTHLAAAIANDFLEHGQGVLFVVVPDLLDHLRATYSPHSTLSYDTRFEEIRSAPLLILDDLGTQASTPWAQEKLFQLFNYRYNTRLPTVITSNLSFEEFDLRLRSRLADPSISRIETIQAPDYRLTGANVPDLSTLALHNDKTFASFDLREKELNPEEAANLYQALQKAKNYADNPKDWLLFTGTFGCGKTHLAAAIANHRASLDQPAFFIVVPDLLDHLRATFSPQALTSYDKRFEEVRNTPFLVLDDLGTQSATPWAQEKLYQLFNHRYNARLPTVITMLEVGELDPRLKSRMLDVERCTAFFIDVGSYRGRPVRHQKTSPSQKPRRNKYHPS